MRNVVSCHRFDGQALARPRAREQLREIQIMLLGEVPRGAQCFIVEAEQLDAQDLRYALTIAERARFEIAGVGSEVDFQANRFLHGPSYCSTMVMIKLFVRLVTTLSARPSAA